MTGSVGSATVPACASGASAYTLIALPGSPQTRLNAAETVSGTCMRPVVAAATDGSYNLAISGSGWYHFVGRGFLIRRQHPAMAARGLQ